MSLYTWTDSKIKNMKTIDIQLVKLTTAAFILMIAKLWQPILSLEWYWYLIIAVLAGIKPISVMLKK